MIVNTNNLFSISEANQNFSRVVRSVDANGDIIILKNNKPAYIVSKYNEQTLTESDYVELVARRILSEHKHAFEELAKWLSLIKIRFYCCNN